MRISTLGALCVLVAADPAFAAGPMSPSDIQATFFTGNAFTAFSRSGTEFKMIFSSNGKMTREPTGNFGYKAEGTWTLNSDGYCTSWAREKPVCFTIIPSNDNKWSVKKGATVVATWPK